MTDFSGLSTVSHSLVYILTISLKLYYNKKTKSSDNLLPLENQSKSNSHKERGRVKGPF